MRNRHSCRAIIRLFNAALIASMLALVAPVWAGPAKPPLELLFAPDSRVMMGTLVEINPAGRLVFKREKVFGNFKDIPELVDTEVTTRGLEIAQMGQRYIVGYTTFHHDRQYPAGVAPTRKGTSILSSSGLDPALFVDSPELRRILELASTERGRESSQLRQLLLQTFAESNPALQRLAAAQFGLDTAMSSKLNGKDKAILQRAATSEHVNPTTRSILITAAADRPADFGPWAADAINKALEITPVDGYSPEAPDPTGLVLLAFDEAGARGVVVPFESLTRWLRSSQQLYLERSAGLLETLYPERSKAAFEEVLGADDTNPATRRFLEAKLREAKSGAHRN